MTGQNELDQKAMGGTELQGKWLEQHVAPELLSQFQIIRSRVRKLEPGKIPILWLHDLAGDPETLHLQNEHSREKFARLVFVSNWQMQTYKDRLGIPYTGRSTVLKNAINPICPANDLRSVGYLRSVGGPIRIIYHSTPHRGLNILAWAFEQLSKKYDNIELHVYSSFKLYGWESRDADFETLFSLLHSMPKVTYYGSVPNDVLRAALAQAHIFAYPSIWEETSCICAMEAMSAGCHIVTPNYGALPETTAGFARMYQWDENIETHAAVFLAALEAQIIECMSKDEAVQGYRIDNLVAQRDYANAMYGWNRRSKEWTALLETILHEQNRTVHGHASAA